MQLTTSRFLMTGASGGIGQALVEQLCAGGAKLLLVGRKSEALQALAQKFPGQVQLSLADLRTRQGRDAVLAAARNIAGLNGLINLAGVNQFSLLEHQDDNAIADMVELNVTATLQLTRHVLPLLRQQENALLVNVGSTFGSIGYPGFTAYCTTKFAIRGFSEALRRELADTRVKVLYVALNRQLKVTMDDPQAVARQIVRAIAREREELYLGWPEKFFVRINSLWPRLVDQALRKQLPLIQRFARSKS
jgi:short-subunit dehydrogenase